MEAMREWGADAGNDLPAHAVICTERALGRIRAWRKKAKGRAKGKPPAVLLKALVHVRSIPTAVGAPGDHYWLPRLGRWASPTEVLRLFGAPEQSSLMLAVRDGPIPISAGSVVACLGRSVHVEAALRIIRMAMDRVQLPEDPRYAASCAGIDLFAVAFEMYMKEQEVLGQGAGKWTYVHASEWRKSVAATLVKVYAHRGLTTQALIKDARKLAPSIGPCEIWSFTPPCEPFSKRNHVKSEEGYMAAAVELQQMLWYPIMWRPLVILVENVAEREAVAAITAALLVIVGYDWLEVDTQAADYTGMARNRHMWVGIRHD